MWKNINSFENVQFFSFLFKNLRLFRKLSNPSFCLMHWRIFTLKVVNCECIAEKDNDTLHSTLCDLDPRGEFSGPINRFLRMVSLFKPLLLDGRFIVADLRWILLIYFFKKCYDERDYMIRWVDGKFIIVFRRIREINTKFCKIGRYFHKKISTFEQDLRVGKKIHYLWNKTTPFCHEDQCARSVLRNLNFE